MKKKAIKIAASTAVAASAFVAAAPAHQADAAVNVNQLVTDAQNAGTVLKWAISVEGTADYKTQPMAQYNAAKNAIAAAEKAAASLSASEKLSVDAKLVDAKLQVKRAQAYIDAITSSVKIKELTAGLDAAIKSDDIEKVEAAYHKATAEYRKQAALLDRVYGQSTRDGIRNEVKPAIEKLVASVKNEVTVNMLVKAASVAGKAGKYEEAAKNLTDAQAILEANKGKLKWENTLQKSADDVADALPLKAIAISTDGKNTVVVKFSKSVGNVLPASQFTFDNGLLAQSAVVSADQKTVTLTTTNQAANTTYALSYQGEATGLTFKTSSAAVGNITVDASSRARLGTDETRTYTVTLKNKDNTPYVGSVAIGLYNGSNPSATGFTTVTANITSANGLVGTPGATQTVNSDTNGKVTFTVAASSAVEVFPFISKNTDKTAGIQFDTEEYLALGRTSFLTLAGSGVYNNVANDQLEISANDFVDKDAKRLVTSYSGANTLFKWDDNDKFYIQGVLSTQAQFEAELSKGDVVHVNYDAAKSGTSVWSIVLNVSLGEDLEVSTPSREVSYDGEGGTYRITGTGQPGHKVNLYKGTASAANYLTTTVVASNGTWSVQALGLTSGANDYEVVQYAPLASPVFADAVAVDTIHFEDFAVATASFTTSSSELSVGDRIEFAFGGAYDHEITTVTNGTITLSRGLLSAKFNVKRVDEKTLEIVSVNGTIPTNFNAAFAGSGSNTFKLTGITGVFNQDKLLLKHANTSIAD